MQELWWGCGSASACVVLELGAPVPAECWSAWELRQPCAASITVRKQFGKISLLLQLEAVGEGILLRGTLWCAAECRGTALEWNCSCNDLLAFIPQC